MVLPAPEFVSVPPLRQRSNLDFPYLIVLPKTSPSTPNTSSSSLLNTGITATPIPDTRPPPTTLQTTTPRTRCILPTRTSWRLSRVVAARQTTSVLAPRVMLHRVFENGPSIPEAKRVASPVAPRRSRFVFSHLTLRT